MSLLLCGAALLARRAAREEPACRCEVVAGPGARELDAEALWKRLGVSRRGGSVVFDDSAPLAALRRAITAPPAAAGAR